MALSWPSADLAYAVERERKLAQAELLSSGGARRTVRILCEKYAEDFTYEGGELVEYWLREKRELQDA